MMKRLVAVINGMQPAYCHLVAHPVGSDTLLVNRLLQSDEDISRKRSESGWAFLMPHADELVSPNVCQTH